MSTYARQAAEHIGFALGYLCYPLSRADSGAGLRPFPGDRDVTEAARHLRCANRLLCALIHQAENRERGQHAAAADGFCAAVLGTEPAFDHGGEP